MLTYDHMSFSDNSVKRSSVTRLYNTPSTILHPVKRSDVTR